MRWVPLHVHSQYTILNSTASVKELAAEAARLKMEALALTDQGNLHGAVDFFNACKGAGVKPLIGCELYVSPGSRLDKKKMGNQRAGYPIVLIAKDKGGYQNLCKLSSHAHLDGFYYTPRIDKELLKEHAKGLICLSGPMRSKVAELLLCDERETLLEELSFFLDLFGPNFYLEITRHSMSEEQMREDGMDRESWLWQASIDYQAKQKRVSDGIIGLSKEKGIPVVATNDSYYLKRGDWQAHEILMNVSSGEPCEIWERDSKGNLKTKIPNPKRKVELTHELYFKSIEEMEILFADCQEALDASVAIANACEFRFDFSSRFYPVFVPPDLEGKAYNKREREEGAERFLRQLCTSGIERRYDAEALEKVARKYPGKDPLLVVKERVAYELDLICTKGLCDYLLIVYDFINWAKTRGIPVGPGRGSGAGSIVCFLTGITDIEPLRFNLFFERFINPERVSYPDIDVDICMERRSEVIDYTVHKYGKDNVAQIITFGTMKAKMAVKDVGRVLNIPLSKVNEIAKLIPEELSMTLEKALQIDPDLKARYDADEETSRLIDLAQILEGSVRSTGIHAAGLIICADPLMDHIPVCSAKDASVVVTQYAMKPVEAVGMLKIDFLGLKTLTAIQLAVEAIHEGEGQSIDWVDLPLDDPKTFEVLNQGKTLGLFQLESGGMQDLCRQLHIDRFEEIIAVGALYRPGPMEMIPSFINRKHGREEIEFDHPMMKEILQETYGIMVYQEQVMMIAQQLAGYSLGAGDVLRKAMGKKDREEMARQKEQFKTGAIANGIDLETAVAIFDKIEKFASYGFNKSHAAAYGYLSYVTAYLKANYPFHWMAALMTSDRDDISKVTKITSECRAMHIPILSPDINESSTVFVANAKGIRFALTAVKGVGEGVVRLLIEERKKGGAFASLHDFISRMSLQKVGKKTIELLIEAGAFDFTGWHRGQLLASVEPIYHTVQKEQKEHLLGQLTFFSLIAGEEERFFFPPDLPPPEKMGVLRREKELLGFYLTGHPLQEAKEKLSHLPSLSIEEAQTLNSGGVCRLACVIEEVTTRLTSQGGKKFAILTIGDGQTKCELPVWSDLYEEKGALFVENQLIYLVVQVEKEEGGGCKLSCRWAGDLIKMDEEEMRLADRAFDQAQGQPSRFGRKKGGGEKSHSVAKESPFLRPLPPTIQIKIDLQKLHLSHLLKLKKLFLEHPGKSPLDLLFCMGGKVVNTLSIGSNWGVEATEQLHQLLTTHPAVIDIFNKEG